MATNYALPRKPYPDPNDPTADPAPAGTYALQRQAPLTEGAQIAQDQNTQGLKTGQFADVQSAQNATARANSLRTANALQDTRGTFARSGADFSPEAASRAQDQAFSAAEAQNLNGTNATNQLQRQYRTDAQNNANTYENQAQNVAKGQQDYLTGQYNTDQANTESARRYDLSRGDQNSQFATTSGQNQQQINNQASQFGQNLNQRQTEFGVTSGQNQQQINNQASQFGQNLNQRQTEFGVTSGQNQQQINNQANQFGQTLGQRDKEFGVTSGQTQQQINNQQSQFGVTSGLEQQKVNNQASQFGVTAGQNQQTIDNQASQYAQKMGYDYASLSQADKEYVQSLVEKQNEFGVTSGQSQQQINNQASQFGTTAGIEQQKVANQANQYDLSRQDQNSQFKTTSGQTQQEINAKNAQTTYQNTQDQINAIQDPKAKAAAQAAFSRGEDVSQFIAKEYNPDGSLNSAYASANPAQQSLQAKVDQLKITTPQNPSESSTAYDARIKDMATKSIAAESNVSQGVTQDAALDRSVNQKLSSGAQLNPDEKAYAVSKGLVNKYTAQTLPTNTDANALKGQQVNVDGQVYTVVGGSRAITGTTAYGGDKHTDYTILDKGGTKVYVVNGKIQSTEPKDI